MSNMKDSAYEGNEQNLLSQEKDSRANEQETIGNTGGTSMLTSRRTQRRRVANPDDPIVQQVPQGPHGPWPGPNYIGSQGRTAIVQGQVYLVAIILIIQLWLVTLALYELLSGRIGILIWLAIASALGFAFALIISLWPRRRVEGS